MICTKRTFLYILAAEALLLVPFLAMQFGVEGWDWNLPDFILMSALLLLAGFALAAASNSQFPLKRRVLAIAVVGFLFLLYVHLAVGIVDSWPLAGS